jgi:2,4-dienoyl-CoA reductase-like NADH-dependent reductase (Old Yellow Enzyme family)
MGESYVAKALTALIFGSPREMTNSEVLKVIEQFVDCAKLAHESGFSGVQLHGAHGYLLSQFLSPKTNLRTDEFGGTPKKRAEIVLRIIKRIREITGPKFCIGIKLNSVDVSDQGKENEEDTMVQVGLIIEEGIDFIEVSGGTFEDPRMMQNTSLVLEDKSTSKPIKASTLAREAFFLDFAQRLRQRYPKVPLMVTGGFRTRAGMKAALDSGACDIIGIARPAAVLPQLPNTILLNKDISDSDAQFHLKKIDLGFLLRCIPVKALGAGAEGDFYTSQIDRIGKGLQPENNLL